MGGEADKKWTYGEIGKSLGRQIIELSWSLQILRDSCNMLRNNRIYYFLPLSGQLRALLTDKSKGKDAHPLLLKLAEKFDKELKLYMMPDTSKSSLPVGEVTMHISGFPVSATRELPSQQQINFKEFPDKKIVCIRGHYYSVREVIGWFANKDGGSHFSPDRPSDFNEWITFLRNPLLQIGEIALQLGQGFLSSLANFEIHFLLAIPKLPNERVYLFDAIYSRDGMRISLLLDKLGKLELSMKDIEGVSIVLKTSEMLDWIEVCYVVISSQVNKDLVTEVKILFNGAIVAAEVVQKPFFVSSAIRDYNVFYNRAANGEEQLFEFGLCEMAMFSMLDDQISRANLYTYFNDKRVKSNDGIIYHALSYGDSPSGISDIRMHGKVTRTENVKEYLKRGKV